MKKLLDFIDKTPITKFLASILIMAMAVIMCMNVILRYIFGFSFNWGDEILRYMSIYCSFLGIAAAFRYGSHIGITVFVEKLFPERTRKFFRLLSDIVTILFMVVLTWFGFVLTRQIIASGQASAAMHLPMYLIYGIVPVSSILSIVQMLLQIFRHKSYLYPRE
ncbi:TRAP transporter small permease [uncultured Dysosmobacter sp.]|uniref:TRAP transporter small permease n=1 Tax=uncultured Dysosmobacter sp. TaxID=2591384 RepID=UPI00261AD68A|nr:TRAP transporter small permease [uncultured Dysosmobacter sp.]